MSWGQKLPRLYRAVIPVANDFTMSIWIRLYPNLPSCGPSMLRHAIDKCKQPTANIDDHRYPRHYPL